MAAISVRITADRRSRRPGAAVGDALLLAGGGGAKLSSVGPRPPPALFVHRRARVKRSP